MVQTFMVCRATLRALPYQRQSWQLPELIPFDDSQLIPLGAGTTLNWKMRPLMDMPE